MWLLSLAALAAPPALSSLKAGDYGGILVTVDPAGHLIAGRFDQATVGNGTEASPQFTCRFAFYAPLADAPSAPVEVWMDAKRSAGVLTAVDAASFDLQLDEQPGGCWNVDPAAGALDKGARFQLDAGSTAPALPFRVVSAEKAFFYSKIDGPPRAAYVVAGDVVTVLAAQEQWVEVSYGATKGWLRVADLRPLPK